MAKYSQDIGSWFQDVELLFNDNEDQGTKPKYNNNMNMNACNGRNHMLKTS